jgi:hypothetical protein
VWRKLTGVKAGGAATFYWSEAEIFGLAPAQVPGKSFILYIILPKNIKFSNKNF